MFVPPLPAVPPMMPPPLAPPPLAPPPAAPPPPPWWSGQIHVPSDLQYSFSFYGISSLLLVFLFCLIYPNVPVYRTRLLLASIKTRPPKISSIPLDERDSDSFRSLDGIEFESSKPRSCFGRAWNRLFAWLYPVFFTSKDDFMRSVGLDGFMFSRVMQFGVEVFSLTTLVCCALVLPINMCGNVVSRNDDKHGNVNNFTRFTMGNIMNGSNLFYVHFVACYLIIFITVFCIRRMFVEYVKARKVYLSEGVNVESKSKAHNNATNGKLYAKEDENDNSVVFDFRGDFYESMHDDGIVIDGSTTFTVNNVHRFVVLMRNVPSITSSTRGTRFPSSSLWNLKLLFKKIFNLLSKPLQLYSEYHNTNDNNGVQSDVSRRESLLASEDATPATGDSTSSSIFGLENGGRRHEDDIYFIRKKLDLVFPNSVSDIVPVFDDKRVDSLMMQLFDLHRNLNHIVEKRASNTRTEFLADKIRAKIESVKIEVESERQAAMNNAPEFPSSCSYFIIFKHQKDAMMARQMLLFESDNLGEEFCIEKAPAHTDIVWSSLINSANTTNKAVRVLLSNIAVAALVILPVGAVSGGLSSLSVLLCSDYKPEDGISLAKFWCHTTPEAVRSFVTGIIPSLIISYYGSVILPTSFYFLALSESIAISKAAVDGRIAKWYWYWSTINVFFSSLAGGSILSQINVALQSPESIPRLIGTAIPKFSNFFINYVMYQALLGNSVSLLLPSFGNVVFSRQLWTTICSYCCCHRFRRYEEARSDFDAASYSRSSSTNTSGNHADQNGHDDGTAVTRRRIPSKITLKHPSSDSDNSSTNDDEEECMTYRSRALSEDKKDLKPRSTRYGRELGLTMLVFLIGFTYCVQSPIIAPVTLSYFAGMWIVWRYHVLYVYVRSYESGGEMIFKYTVDCIFNSMKIMIVLMASLFLIYTRWSLGVLLLLTLMPYVVEAHSDMEMRIQKLDEGVPLETVMKAIQQSNGGTRRRDGSDIPETPVKIPSDFYMPSSLRRRGHVWSPNNNMVWVNWNCPRHGF